MDKIIDLLDRLERIKFARENEPEPDALSVSLWEMGAELSALDDEGIAALADGWGCSLEDVRKMALDLSK